jgi:hypothetical protein
VIFFGFGLRFLCCRLLCFQPPSPSDVAAPSYRSHSLSFFLASKSKSSLCKQRGEGGLSQRRQQKKVGAYSNIFRARIFKLLRSPGINSTSICSLAGRYNKLIPTRFLAPKEQGILILTWFLVDRLGLLVVSKTGNSSGTKIRRDRDVIILCNLKFSSSIYYGG